MLVKKLWTNGFACQTLLTTVRYFKSYCRGLQEQFQCEIERYNIIKSTLCSNVFSLLNVLTIFVDKISFNYYTYVCLMTNKCFDKFENHLNTCFNHAVSNFEKKKQDQTNLILVEAKRLHIQFAYLNNLFKEVKVSDTLLFIKLSSSSPAWSKIYKHDGSYFFFLLLQYYIQAKCS